MIIEQFKHKFIQIIAYYYFFLIENSIQYQHNQCNPKKLFVNNIYLAGKHDLKALPIDSTPSILPT